ncbi:MAG TPA: recombinase family protein [Candidatus Binatia bacterium]
MVGQNQQAAIYIRMSTERQVYSTEHQRARLQQRAIELGLVVVAEYLDSGKSGLTIKGRPEISRLLGDALSGSAEFSTVLVYDVSRWGRFQDVDEAAHYEYICRHAGIRVIYCAEQFADDGTPLSGLLKSIKRTMAAEYSRELSAKVFAAQCRLTEMGFKQGGSAGFGLRRALVDSNGQLKRTLLFGDRKGNTTDRVIFTLGPAQEVELVRRIYRLYVNESMTQTAIAMLLNGENIPSEFGRPWTIWNVKGILTNEKYIGNVVFNRRSFKLKNLVVHNSPGDWVRHVQCFPAIISPDMFEQARATRKNRLTRPTKSELLEFLRGLHLRRGKVNAKLMAEERLPNPKVYAHHFGSLWEAYSLAGLPSTKFSKCAQTKRDVHANFKQTLADVVDAIARAGGTATRLEAKGLLMLNGAIMLQVIAVRSRHEWGRQTWKMPFATNQRANFIICAQLDRSNQTVAGYYLFPTADFDEAHCTVGERDLAGLAKYRHDSIASVFALSSGE